MPGTDTDAQQTKEAETNTDTNTNTKHTRRQKAEAEDAQFGCCVGIPSAFAVASDYTQMPMLNQHKSNYNQNSHADTAKYKRMIEAEYEDGAGTKAAHSRQPRTADTHRAKTLPPGT
jgi:hypothetical protein